MEKGQFIKLLKKIWHFICEDDSLLSWIVNIVLAIILIKFIIYPGMGLAFGTKFPIVAVVSDSMEHKAPLDSWWEMHHNFYEQKNISFNEFKKMPFKNGFNKGDLMVIFGAPPSKIRKGDIIIFMAGKPDPIIHRVVDIKNIDGQIVFETKGDKNQNQIVTSWLDETNVSQNSVIGRATLRLPFLGWIKIIAVKIFVSIINFLR